MISILMVPLILALLFLAERQLYRKFWNRNLSVVLEFEKDHIEVGERCTLKETVINQNFLPVPFMQAAFSTDTGIELEDAANMTVTDHTNMWDIFSTGPYEKIVRALPIAAKRRGYYRILMTSVTGSDVLTGDRYYANMEQKTHLYVYPERMPEDALAVPMERIMGEVETRRYLYEDVFSFRGIREYVPTDPMTSINWAATAKTGILQVNLHDAGAGRSVCLMLNVENPAVYFWENILEDAIRITASVGSQLIGQNMPVSLITNGRDLITGNELGLKAGASGEHQRTLLEMLSRIDLSKEKSSFADILRGEMEEAGRTNRTYVLVSSNGYGDIQDAAEEFGKVCGRLLWLCPLTPDMPDITAGPHVEFIRINH